MLRRAISSLPGHVASSQRRGYLTLILQNGTQKVQYNLAVAWKSAAASPSNIVRVLPPQGGKADAARVTLNSVEGETVIASADLMPAATFHSKSSCGRGREKSLVDIFVWPNQSRACATIMRRNAPAIQRLYRNGSSRRIRSFDEISLYSTGHTIGSGAEGKVFKCVSLQGGHLCAVKKYSSRKPVGEEPREPRIMKMLSHPNVKRLYFAWKETKPGAVLNRVSTIYLPQELCKGTIDDYLDEKTERTTHEKLKIFKDTVFGLRYLHQQGIVHRDIKLGNIFLDNLHRVKLGDFGSGTFIESNSCMGGKKFWGTALYASPELWCSNAHNQKTDIFSLGVVYFELLGGRATNDVRHRRLEELHKLLKSRNWKTKPLETWHFKRVEWKGRTSDQDVTDVPRSSAQMSRNIASPSLGQ